ncbi:MAG TPA: hypothetical protein VMO17_18730 [Terriglobia bacterium]|nr:hypothetical protein [Terriglobia bacterium]
MKITGLLLMPSGWFIVLAALVLLRTIPALSAFVAAGMGVEILGLVLLIRSHLTPKGGNE